MLSRFISEIQPHITHSQQQFVAAKFKFKIEKRYRNDTCTNGICQKHILTAEQRRRKKKHTHKKNLKLNFLRRYLYPKTLCFKVQHIYVAYLCVVYSLDCV